MAKLSIVTASVAALAATSVVSSFSVTPCKTRSSTHITSGSTSSSSLHTIIRGEDVDAQPLDENEGGVGLALRSAIKISGKCIKEQCDAQELLRYEKMQELDRSVAQSIMEKSGCNLLCTGMGKELYQDPGTSVRYEDKIVKLAPLEAAKAALAVVSTSASALLDSKYVVINFVGGDDLIIGEVLLACDMLVQELNLLDNKATKVMFNSISFKEFADETCSVAVVACAGNAVGLEGVDENIAKGELYVYDGKWYTVAEGDITTAEK